MQAGQPSRTARGAAAHRAAHQRLENPLIFVDPLAALIVGEGRESDRAVLGMSDMRAFIVARSRFAEDGLAAAVARGVRAYALLGAGLDTFAYRNPYEGLRVYELDHAATQNWKRARLADAGIVVPDSVEFLPFDFDRDDLCARLREAGLPQKGPVYFAWSGVTPYLKRETIERTLCAVAAWPGGAEICFDYGEPPAMYGGAAQAAYEDRAARVAAAGEPWISFFRAPEIHALIKECGLELVEDIGAGTLDARYFHNRVDAFRPLRGGRLVRARTP
jgi:methyltransferase (TIGR00027 family)